MRRAQALIIFFLCGAAACGLGVSTAYADYNWPYGPPPDARPPQVPQPVPGTPKDPCDTDVSGSIISCQSQTLGEAVPITGTPFQLHYGSDRMPGRKDAYTLDIPLSGATLPTSLRRIELQVSVAGKKFTQNFGPTPNQHYSFSWDGKDAYGRTVQGGRSPRSALAMCTGRCMEPLRWAHKALGLFQALRWRLQFQRV